jgi:hypothetical protein
MFGQHWLPIQYDTTLNYTVKKSGVQIEKKKKNEIILTGIADYSGTSLGKDITQKIFYGGEITDSMKQKSLDRHKAVNRFGSDIQAELEYRNYQVNLFKHENWGLVIKSGMYNFLQAIYSKDLFSFPMYGNDFFAGDTANFSGSRFTNLTYQKIGFGWLDKKSKSAVSLNLFGLNNFSSLNLSQGEIFQNVALDSLAFNYNGTASFTNGQTYLKGIGAGLDVDIRWQSKGLKGKPYFQFLMRNVGFISQTTNMTTYKADTSFSYNGFSYNQLVNGVTFQSGDFAVLDSLGISKSEKKSTFLLPGMFQISKLIDQSEGAKSKKLQEFYGARLYLSNMAIPMVFGGIDYNPFNGLVHFGISGSYGGFSKLKGAMYSSLKLNNFSLGLSSENLFSKTGQSIILRLQCVF